MRSVLENCLGGEVQLLDPSETLYRNRHIINKDSTASSSGGQFFPKGQDTRSPLLEEVLSIDEVFPDSSRLPPEVRSRRIHLLYFFFNNLKH